MGLPGTDLQRPPDQIPLVKSNPKTRGTAHEPPQIVQTAQKQPNWQKNLLLSNELISLFKRSQFCFCLNTVIIVEVDVFGYDEASLLISGKFYSVDTLDFECGKEIFG